MKQRKVRVNLQIELFGERYRLVVDRNAKSQSQKHCDKCALRGRGVCYWDNEKGIDDEKSITANLFCQDTSEYGRWFGYWSHYRQIAPEDTIRKMHKGFNGEV